jgi:hypothetical protein
MDRREEKDMNGSAALAVDRRTLERERCEMRSKSETN